MKPIENHRNSDIAQCRIIDLPRHRDVDGDLTEVENTPEHPFEVKRVFYLYDLPSDSRRGGHSHYEGHEIIVAASGAFSVTVDDGKRKHTYLLDRPYKGLYIPPGVWRTLEGFSSGSVCLVLTSEKYNETDYERDYGEFLRLTTGKVVSQEQQYQFLSLAEVNAPFAQALKEAAKRVIESGSYIGGPEVETFENEMIAVSGAPYNVGVSNGLDALRLILRGYLELGKLRPGDEVIVQADTYVASVLAITDMGLTPVLVDADWRTMNLDTSKIESAITRRTRAIMPVHLYGLTCWDERLFDAARRHDLLVIEDNAQAIGALAPCEGLFGTRLTGGLGHAGAFSFYPTKNIGALGDAGAIATHDEELAHAVRALRNYGTDRQYHNVYAGYNCRLDPIQAAFLRVKLPYIDEENALKRRLARVYLENIHNPLVTKPYWPEDPLQCVWHQTAVRVADRDGFRKYLKDNGVQTSVHYPAPPHMQPCYASLAHAPMPVAERIDREIVSLPCSRGTSEADALTISQIINGYKG